MVGRLAYSDPYGVSLYQRTLFNPDLAPLSRSEIVQSYLPYVEAELSRGTHLKHMTRHLLNLFRGQPGAKHWRRHLTRFCTIDHAGTEVIHAALAYVDSTHAFPILAPEALATEMSRPL